MANSVATELSSSSPDPRTDLTLLRAQKSELIAELTGVMANQFNNTMMAITGYAELEMKKLPVRERRSLEQIVSSAGRATALVQKLLAISRKHTSQPHPIDLNHVLTELAPLLEQFVGERVLVALNLNAHLARVEADPVELDEALLGLALAARSAMTDGGKMSISTKLDELNPGSTREGEKPGPYVVLSIEESISDGRNDAVEQQAQEASTYKFRVSLSLATVRGIVRHSGGFVRIGFEPEKGASVTVYFPALQAATGKGEAEGLPRKLPLARTILLVDDDDAVRIPASEFLKMEGFKVLQARTGEEALHVVQQNRSCVDVLITDVVMPKMNGHEVARQLVELQPGLKVLYMSGDADGARLPHGTNYSQAALRKPFRLDALKDTIHELLGE